MRYLSGEEILAGDYLLWHGDPARVESVSDPERQPADWYVISFGEGATITPPTVYETAADDLDFVGRTLALPAVVTAMVIEDHPATSKWSGPPKAS